MRRSTARRPTRRIVVPLAPVTDAALQSRRPEMSLRDQVLAALALAYDCPVPAISRRRRNPLAHRGSGRARQEGRNRVLSVILPPATFAALQRLAKHRHETFVFLIRHALAVAGYPMSPSDHIIDRRRRSFRVARCHYAARDAET